MKHLTKLFLICAVFLFFPKLVFATTPEEILSHAFGNFYPTYSRAELTLTNIKNGDEGIVRNMNVVLRRGDDGIRMRAQFTSPQEIRHTAALMHERKDGCAGEAVTSNDYWIYLPALRKSRRISGSQRADSFFGTELSHGDMEPRRACHFSDFSLSEDTIDEEVVYVVSARPRFDAGYDVIRFYIAITDFAILKIEQFRLYNSKPKLYRVITAPRSATKRFNGHSLPMQLTVETARSNRKTVIEFTSRELPADIPQQELTLGALERGH